MTNTIFNADGTIATETPDIIFDMNPYLEYLEPDLFLMHESLIITNIIQDETDDCIPCNQQVQESSKMTTVRTQEDFNEEVKNFGLRLVPYGQKVRSRQIKTPFIKNETVSTGKLTPAQLYNFYNDPEGKLPDDAEEDTVIYTE